jgi:hypothetical protein
MRLSLNTDRGRQASGTTHAGATQTAIAAGIFRKILLVIVLGIVKFRGFEYFRCNRAQAAGLEALLVAVS